MNGKSYKLTHLLGRGASAKVYRAIDEDTGDVVAVKIIDLEGCGDAILNAYLKETTLLEKLKSCEEVIKMFNS